MLLWQAHLRSENFAEAEADADTALEFDPCAVKVLLWRPSLWRRLSWPVPFAVRACACAVVVQAYVRKAKAMHGAGNYAGAKAAIADALAVRPANKEVNRRENSPRLLA